MKRVSAAERLLLALAQGIAEGRWLPDQPLPPVRTMAREMGVSPPTAVKVVRLAAERGLVSLRRNRPARVLPEAPQIAAQLLGRCAPLHRQAPPGAGQTRIALLYPDVDWPLTNPIHVSFRMHLDLLAERAGLQFDLVAWPLKDQISFALSLPACGYAGAVCLGMRGLYQGGLVALRNQKFPTLIINRRFRHLGLPALTSDDYKPSRDLALRLARMGHRNVSLVADLLPTVDMEAHGAIRGWVDGLVEADILDHCVMPTCILPHLEPLKRSPRTFEQILLRPDRPTALFFYWPVWSNVLLVDPRFAQFRVPDDLSIVLAIPGERPLTLPHGPPLTSLDCDYERLAGCAVEIITDLIAGKPRDGMLQLPLKLNLTESIGPPPGR